MKRYWKRIIALLLLIVSITLVFFFLKEFDLEFVKEHRQELIEYVKNHFLKAAIIYIFLYFLTALFLPGALALTVAGGMLFGKFQAVILVNIAATIGAIAAWFASRYFFGKWLQERFNSQLILFNKEMEKHGHNYLLVLRTLPVIPFFVVNYCAGLTKIPLRTFVWTTSLGMLPGSFIYAFAGEQLRKISGARDLISWKPTLALILISLFALLPVILKHLPGRKKKTS